MNQKWHKKEDLKRVSYNVSSPRLEGLELLACDCIRGEWYFTLDNRHPDSTYFGPYRSKEQADRVLATFREHPQLKRRLKPYE